MPEVKLRHVVSCSSEDPTFKAENLLKADTYRKWRSRDKGEKQISVILQFEKAELIHSIDIGNEGSAFVEVLVGNSMSACQQDFEVILVSSFFMSPMESRSGNNLNRVRMFGPDKLAKGVLGKKWDRVKVVCTQPYNKNLCYGLSFIRFHSGPDLDEKMAGPSSPKVTWLGPFVVKEEEGCNEGLKPGSLFNRASRPRLSTTASPPPPSQGLGASYADATLQASGVDAPGGAERTPGQLAARSPTDKADAPRTKRKFEFPKEKANPPVVRKEKEALEGSGKKTSPLQPTLKRQKVEPPPAKSEPPSSKPDTEGLTGAKSTDLRSILQGAVLVLSGFQNPFRSELRDKALEMGARYRSDWDPECTHLICAFANTPKYTQVKALGGAVVRKDWILDCYKRKRRLSHKRYLLDGAGSSSEEGEEAKGHSPKSAPPQTLERKVPRKELPDPHRPQQREEVPSTSRLGDRDSEGSTEEDRTAGDEVAVDEDSDCDTEEEIKRVQEHIHHRGNDDPYTASTDENTDIEDGVSPDLPIPELPDLFQGKHFLLYGEFPGSEHRLLTRYITAFNGSLEDYMSESVNFVVTAEDWDDRFDEALMENSNLAFVRPRWVYTCNERQRLVPHQPFVVVPSI